MKKIKRTYGKLKIVPFQQTTLFPDYHTFFSFLQHGLGGLEDWVTMSVKIFCWCFPFHGSPLPVFTDVEFDVCEICVRLSTLSQSLLGQNK